MLSGIYEKNTNDLRKGCQRPQKVRTTLKQTVNNHANKHGKPWLEKIPTLQWLS